MKDWDAICRDLSSGEDSDEYDELNVQSVTKNAKRVAELMHHLIPGLDPNEGGAQPMGMNRASILREHLSRRAEGGKATPPAKAAEATPPASATVAAEPPAAVAAEPPAAPAAAEPHASATDAAPPSSPDASPDAVESCA